MKRSIARRVALAATALLAAALAAVGASTGAVLHLREVAELDRALVAAAHASARAGARDDDRGIETWIAAPGERRVQPRVYARAAAADGPLVKDLGRDRIALLAAPTADGAPRVVAALAPRITLARSVGGFAVAWLLASAVALALAAIGLSAAVRLALRPLDRARDEVARVMGLGGGQRVATDAPEEVRPLLVAVNELLDRLDGAHATQVRFTADAAHELRTPVTALLGELDLALRRERPAAEWRDALVAARGDVLRLRRLVEALTALARVDAGDVAAHRELVRAAELAGAALEAEAAELAGAGCRAALRVVDDPELEVHRVLLELALGNLLRNAARHAPGADVTLTVRRDGPLAVFEVRDTGRGPPRELGDAVFDRFARGGADPTGLGLGLPLAREVARRHGGDCALEPAEDRGARAVLTVRAPT